MFRTDDCFRYTSMAWLLDTASFWADHCIVSRLGKLWDIE